MDPLALAPGLSGLITTADKISSCLSAFTAGMLDAPNLARNVVAETQALSEIFTQLQTTLWRHGGQDVRAGRPAMVFMDHVVLTITGCITLLAELEKEMEGVGTADASQQFLDRLRWTMREAVIRRILDSLQMQKEALVLVLTILTV